VNVITVIEILFVVLMKLTALCSTALIFVLAYIMTEKWITLSLARVLQPVWLMSRTSRSIRRRVTSRSTGYEY